MQAPERAFWISCLPTPARRQQECNAPGGYLDLQLSQWDWQFKTTPQKNFHNRVSFWPRGKVLGGCSATNAMIYVRGSAGACSRAPPPARPHTAMLTVLPGLNWPRMTENYDNWAANGCTGWSFKEVLPYFKKSENCFFPNVDRLALGDGDEARAVLLRP